MNLREELNRICDEGEEMPVSEMTREIRGLLADYPALSAIEICENEPVLDYDSEPF